VTQEFPAWDSVFILPDQAQVGAAYNANSAQIRRSLWEGYQH